MRIAEGEIERIKQGISLKQVIEADGYKPKRHGKDFVISCPFHNEKTPSLIITPSTNLWHCMSCGKGGSVIDWVMEQKGLNFYQAYHHLSKSSFIPLAAKRKNAEKPEASIITEIQKDAAQWAINKYHGNLKQSTRALSYLAMRGLDSPNIIDHFKLGFSEGPFESNKFDRQLNEIGLIGNQGRTHFYNSLIIPIIDENGDVSEIYGRRIDDKAPCHRYLPGPHHGIFNASQLTTFEDIIVTESLIDAISLWTMGYINVTSSYGTEGFTKDHLAFIERHRIKRVFIAYDCDEAGINSSKKLQAILNRDNIKNQIITFPKGMDANNFYLAYPDADDRFKKMLDQSAIPESVPVIAEVADKDIQFQIEERSYRIRGLIAKSPNHQLKVNIFLKINDLTYIDTVDLYSARGRKNFALMVKEELNYECKKISSDLNDLVCRLEKIRDNNRSPKLPKASFLAAKEKDRALAKLRNPKLAESIINDFTDSGLVGESKNLLVAYLAAISRKMDKPLAIIVQSSSSAGKSSLMDAVLAMIPKSDKVEYSAMTGQSLFYLGEKYLKNKILAISEEEGAEHASYALKLMQSEGSVTIASTGKGKDGRHETHEYQVEGPVMLFMTTTSVDLNEELVNRCLVLSVNESREQTEAIHRLQREEETLAGLKRSEKRREIIQLHHAIQSLLQPIKIINPYAEKLTFQSHKTRTRRDHKKYLSLIRVITFLYQYQRPQKTYQYNDKNINYIETTKEDIILANELAHEVLGRSLDELPPHTRKLLCGIKSYLLEKARSSGTPLKSHHFTRKEIREYCGLGHEQTRIHLCRLVDMEYVLTHKGKRGQSFVYELLYDGSTNNSSIHLPGLIDSSTLK